MGRKGVTVGKVWSSEFYSWGAEWMNVLFLIEVKLKEGAVRRGQKERSAMILFVSSVIDIAEP